MLRKIIAISEEYSEYLKSNNHEPLDTTIEETLRSDGFKLDEICVRFVREENLPSVIKCGTDRNGYGISFDSFSKVEDQKIMARYGLKPADFTYAIDDSLHDLSPGIYGAQIKRVQTMGGKLEPKEYPNYICMLVYRLKHMKPLTLSGETTDPFDKSPITSQPRYGRGSGCSLRSVFQIEPEVIKLDAKSFTSNPLDALEAIYNLRLS